MGANTDTDTHHFGRVTSNHQAHDTLGHGSKNFHGTSSEEQDHPSSGSDSGSNSTGKTSPPTTPPDQNVIPVKSPPTASLGPRVNHDASYSATPPRRSKKQTPPRSTARLGAIDEQSISVAPDVPARHPRRKHHRYGAASRFFTFGAYSRSDQSIPPLDAYKNVIGPRGEKFQDLRQNKPFQPRQRGGWRRMICIGAIVLVVLLAIGLGVGLGVGLTRDKGNSSQDTTQPTDSDLSSNDPSPFPVGTWSISTYLTTQSTDCTSESSTWRCFPYTSYDSSSPSSSFNTLTWRITSPTNSSSDLRISNTNPTFSYPFNDILLSLTNSNDPRLSAYTFEYTYRKQVIPNADITGDGAATRCYYNNTLLSVRLYSTEQGAGGDIESENNNSTATTTQDMTWPYAIEFEETIGSSPECFRYSNGLETDAVTVPAGSGDCVCAYRNYGLD